MEQERSRNIAVGLTTLAGLAGLVALLFLFGDLLSFVRQGYPIDIHYPNAAGLYTGSRVRLDGIDVGHVQHVRLKSPAGSGVIVTASIMPDIRLPQGITAIVKSPILGGASSIDLIIDPDTEPSVGILPTDGSARIQGEIGSIESRLAREMKSVIEGPSQQFEKLTGSFVELSDEWKQLATNLNQLTRQQETEDVDAGRLTGNLATVMARADARLAEMETAIANINAWAGDEQLREDFKDTMANASQASATLNASITNVERRVIAVADDMSQVTASIEQVLATAHSDKGTVGKLLNDPALYDNLNDSAQRLQKALDEARLLLEKWKREGVPVQF